MECSINVYRSIWSKIWFKSIVYLLIFCIDDLSISESSILNSSITVILSISPFWFINIWLIYLGIPMLGSHIYDCYMFLMNWLPYSYIVTFFVSFYHFWLKVYFVQCNVASPAFFFFRFLLAYDTFVHPFILNSFVSLELNCLL